MKSLLVNVFFPAWVWCKFPEKKFLFSSYSSHLAIRDSILCRQLIESNLYKSFFPHLRLAKDQNQKQKFRNLSGGSRLAVGVGGSITGEGGDFIVVDDPIKADEVFSESNREKVNFWWDNTMTTRLNDPTTGVRIIIQQRLHQDDLVGHILQKQKDLWETVILPLEKEGKRYTSSLGLDDPREEGEILWKDRFSPSEVGLLKNSMQAISAAGQLQQRPYLEEGNIYKQEWFSTAHDPQYVRRFLSWDTATTANRNSAYSACVIGDVLPSGKLYIRHVYREKLEFPMLLKKIIEICEQFYNPNKGFDVVIEEKSSGLQLIQTLRENSIWGEFITPFQPKGDKVSRAHWATYLCEKGQILFPDSNPNWLQDFKDELFSFPASNYKDQVDAFNQLVFFTKNFICEV